MVSPVPRSSIEMCSYFSSPVCWSFLAVFMVVLLLYSFFKYVSTVGLAYGICPLWVYEGTPSFRWSRTPKFQCQGTSCVTWEGLKIFFPYICIINKIFSGVAIAANENVRIVSWIISKRCLWFVSSCALVQFVVASWDLCIGKYS